MDTPETDIWALIQNYFETHLTSSIQLESYNVLVTDTIPSMINGTQFNIEMGQNEILTVRFGNVYIEKPSLTTQQQSEILFPSDARLRDLSYDTPVYVDLYTVYSNTLTQTTLWSNAHKHIILFQIPVMVRSVLCNLTTTLDHHNECDSDVGGYFIIKGKERVLISQERINYNHIYVYSNKKSKYDYVAEIRSTKESDYSVLIRILLLNSILHVSLPYISQDIPLGIVLKAIHVDAEYAISFLKSSCDSKMNEIIIDSIRSYSNLSFEDCIDYIGQYTVNRIQDNKRFNYTVQLLENEILPHLGVYSESGEQGDFLLLMVLRLLQTHFGLRPEDDRDHVSNKRIESCGALIGNLLQLLFKRYIKTSQLYMEKKRDTNILGSIHRFNITQRLYLCFATGNWGISKSNYIRQGVSQILNRLSYNGTISHLRRVIIPIGKESKNTKVRQLHPSSFGYNDPAETPEGGTAGLIKNFSALLRITNGTSSVLMRDLLESFDLKLISRCLTQCGLFINGIWIGSIETCRVQSTLEMLWNYRQINCFPFGTSIAYDPYDNELHVHTCEGRMTRPLFNLRHHTPKGIRERISSILTSSESQHVWSMLEEENMILWIDSYEVEYAVVATDLNEAETRQEIDFSEIHPSLIMGTCSNLIPFPEHSQCIETNELVLLHDGTVKKICEIKVGDKVITFDPLTQSQTIADVSHTTTHSTDKQMYELETTSHRKIIATFDHRFMTNQGWLQLEQLKSEGVLVAVSLEQSPVSTVNCNAFRVMDYEMYIQKCNEKNIQVHSGQWIYSLFPIESHSSSLFIIARLFGFCMSRSKIENDAFTVFFEQDVYDTHLFNTDIEQLGLKKGIVSKVNRMYRIQFDSIFLSLLTAFGINELRLPYWVINGSDMVKREFVAGFQGGCGMKIRNVHIGATCINVSPKNTSSTVYMMTQMTELLYALGVGVNSPMITTNTGVTCISYAIHNTRENLILYFDRIGYRYDVKKIAESGQVIEYMRITKKELSLKKWLNTTTTTHTTLFMPIHRLTKTQHHIISDITINSPNQSFLCGQNFCVHNSPRNVYISAMMKQSMGLYASNYRQRFDTSANILHYPQNRLVRTQYETLLKMNENPCGINTVVAIACYTGFNMEDSIILNKGAIDRGMFRSTSYKTVSSSELKQGTHGFYSIEIPNDTLKHVLWDYSKLDSDGIIKVGSIVDENTVMIGKVYYDHEIAVRDSSLLCGKSEVGIVDSICITLNASEYTHVKIKIRSTHIPEVGDKFVSSAAQKGTVGMVMRQEDMPFSMENGICPDLILNAHAIPSRMTINMIMEMLCGKAGLIKGTIQDATAFCHSDKLIDKISEILKENGYDGMGDEFFINGMTGQQFKMKIFMGTSYYARLKHLVKDKIHTRSRGEMQLLTRQPVAGRSKGGGLRFGEMERDAMITHGCSIMLKERLFDMSDPYQLTICSECGHMTNRKNECEMCNSCETKQVHIPYASKLLFQELITMGIKINLK